MQIVPRHEIDLDFAGEQAERLRLLVDSALSDVEKSVDALGAARRRVIMRLQYLLARDPAAEDEETWRAVVLASEVSNAPFAVASASGGVVSRQIGGQERDIPAAGPNRHATAGDWFVATWLAVITRSESRIQELCAVDPAVIAGSGAQYDDYVGPWMQTLRTFLRHEQVPQDLFQRVVAQTAPDATRYSTEEFLLWIATPPIKMFYKLLLRDAEGFNDALAQALRLHDEFWSTGDRADDPDGYVDFEALAIAVLARAVRLPVEVESPYLPAGLLNRR